MNSRKRAVELYLQPGDLFFGDYTTRMHTLLGSCVAITLWHPRLQIGGMCHYMMPGGHPDTPISKLDGRYAADAIALFRNEVRVTGTRPGEWVTKMFGGGSQFPKTTPAGGNGLPARNIKAGITLLGMNGFSITAKHFGGNGHRQVVFDIDTGDVWLKHVDAVSPRKDHLG
jgi:chemotaxis protein CheD